MFGDNKLFKYTRTNNSINKIKTKLKIVYTLDIYILGKYLYKKINKILALASGSLPVFFLHTRVLIFTATFCFPTGKKLCFG